MLRRLSCAVLATVTMVGSSLGHNSSAMSEELLGSGGHLPDISSNSNPKAIHVVSDDLLGLIAVWLAQKFGFPTDGKHPQVQLVEPESLIVLSRRAPGMETGNRATKVDSFKPSDAGDRLAVYDDAHRIIYLTRGWTGTTAAEASILVHEMVHHLQNIAGEKFECPEAREKAAYSAQEAWLEMFGSSLEKQLDVDPFTLLVLSTCKY